ncbi:MAG: hypothetical protein KKG59_06585 [Nanoarchaeota archaeon]|nr:hypothetical protein [Nanoarchaeota archaeon]
MNYKNIIWTHYITRPMPLFFCVNNHYWYASSRTKELLGANLPTAMYVEEKNNVYRYYYPKKDRAIFLKTILALVKDKNRITVLLKEGLELNTRAKSYLEKGHEFTNAKDALLFLNEMAIRSTILPFNALQKIKDVYGEKHKIFVMCEQLRRDSFYPPFQSIVLRTLLIKELRELSEQNPERLLEVLLPSEFLAGNILNAEERLSNRKQIIFQSHNLNDEVIMAENNDSLIRELEHIPEGTDELKGQVAYNGLIRGKARIVLDPYVKNITFEKGEILVTINSNPFLMPVIKKCAAIVTDEGGITCHAAIISRELKKPCVIGTKIATQVLQDGDLIEVDANKGIVRKINAK